MIIYVSNLSLGVGRLSYDGSTCQTPSLSGLVLGNSLRRLTIASDFHILSFSYAAQELTFAPHIYRLCRDFYHQLRQLALLVSCLPSNAIATLVYYKACPSLISSYLDLLAKD